MTRFVILIGASVTFSCSALLEVHAELGGWGRGSAWCESDCIANCEKRVGTAQPERDNCVYNTARCSQHRGRPCYGYPKRNPLESVVGPKAKRPAQQ